MHTWLFFVDPDILQGVDRIVDLILAGLILIAELIAAPVLVGLGLIAAAVVRLIAYLRSTRSR